MTVSQIFVISFFNSWLVPVLLLSFVLHPVSTFAACKRVYTYYDAYSFTGKVDCLLLMPLLLCIHEEVF